MKKLSAKKLCISFLLSFILIILFFGEKVYAVPIDGGDVDNETAPLITEQNILINARNKVIYF